VDLNSFEAILLDLDGTVYYEEHPLPGAVELVRRLQRERRKFACLSNATTSPLRIMMRLKRMGIDLDDVTHIYTAGAAACDYVMQRFTKDQTTGQLRRPRVYNLATEGVEEMLEGLVDWVATFGEPCDAVIAGAPSNVFATDERQRVALQLLRRGTLLVGVCNDRVYPSPRGLEFGSGALSAMLAYASGAAPVFCGKPESIFFRTLCQRLDVEPAKCLLIGDNLEADIAGAKAMGMKTILTLTGVTRRRDVMQVSNEMQPDAVIENLEELGTHENLNT
jgi:HAD superfamily hydrolase (TIGR01450 family)